MKQALLMLAKIDIRDLHCYGGIALIATGLWLVYCPLSLVVTGTLLLYLALRRVK